MACEGVFPLVHVVAEGGNDKITMDLLVNEFKMNAEVYGDAGDDELRATPDNRDLAQPTTYMEGGSGNDTLVSGNGVDELLGGDGNDTMQSFSGADTVRGEGGDDSVSAGKEEPLANAADVVDGGPGFDSIPDVDADYNRGNDDNVTVTVNGAADDGEAGEGDNVIGVEKLRVVADQATVVGDDAPTTSSSRRIAARSGASAATTSSSHMTATTPSRAAMATTISRVASATTSSPAARGWTSSTATAPRAT